jgi:SPP1 family predicted phage head-tail adaptor
MLVTIGRGYSVFDGTNTEVDISHVFYIRFDDSVSSETWILFEDARYDIVTTEDLDMRHEWMRLNCVVRGAASVPVNAA